MNGRAIALSPLHFGRAEQDRQTLGGAFGASYGGAGFLAQERSEAGFADIHRIDIGARDARRVGLRKLKPLPNEISREP
jgi:hypothetical protein